MSKDKWNAPLHLWVKLNTEASARPAESAAAVGGVLRDTEGL